VLLLFGVGEWRSGGGGLIRGKDGLLG